MLWQDWAREEEAVKYASNPYITVDEELDYLESIGRKHQDVDPLYTSKISAPMEQRYSVDILEFFERNRNHEEFN